MVKKITNMMKYYSIQSGSGGGAGTRGEGGWGRGQVVIEAVEEEEDDGGGSLSEYNSEDGASSSEEENEGDVDFEGERSTDGGGLSGRKRRRNASRHGSAPPGLRRQHSRESSSSSSTRHVIPTALYNQPIEQLDKNTGEVLGSFATILEAAAAVRTKPKIIYCNMLYLAGEEQPGKSRARAPRTAAGCGKTPSSRNTSSHHS